PRRRGGLAAAVLAGLAALALHGCGKRTPPADEPGKSGKPSNEGESADARRTRMEQSQKNLKQIGMAIHSFHDTYKQLPPAAICDKKTGRPLLSWRVLLLPYLEQEPLFMQFKTDEPWDGPTNKKLLEKMPPVYAPVGVTTKEAHATFYRGFVSPPGSPITSVW